MSSILKSRSERFVEAFMPLLVVRFREFFEGKTFTVKNYRIQIEPSGLVRPIADLCHIEEVDGLSVEVLSEITLGEGFFDPAEDSLLDVQENLEDAFPNDPEASAALEKFIKEEQEAFGMPSAND